MHEDIWKTRTRLTEQELADYWGMKLNTIRKWRSNGTGPAYLKIGSHVVYTREDIEKYENARKFRAPNDRILPPV